MEKADATAFIMNMSFSLAGTWHIHSLQLPSFAQLFPLIPTARYKEFNPSSCHTGRSPTLLNINERSLLSIG